MIPNNDDDPDKTFLSQSATCCFVERNNHLFFERINNHPLPCAFMFYSFCLDYWPGQKQGTTDWKLRHITLTDLERPINLFNDFPSVIWSCDVLTNHLRGCKLSVYQTLLQPSGFLLIFFHKGMNLSVLPAPSYGFIVIQTVFFTLGKANSFWIQTNFILFKFDLESHPARNIEGGVKHILLKVKASFFQLNICVDI